MSMTNIYSGGFADPAVAAAHGFRAAMDVMARPGTRREITGGIAPEGLSPAAASLILLVGTLFFPFLEISTAGLKNATSVLDVVLAFTSEELALLVLFTAGCILAIPALRMALLLYVLVPLVFDHAPRPQAKRAFLLAEQLKPWSMAEIFAIGCAVALIKVKDLAHVEFGPAFWMFAVLVLLVAQVQRNLCSRSVWDALEGDAPDVQPEGNPA